MNFLRQLHLYSGCFFTPILLLFVVSGAWQTFRLQDDQKSGYRAPAALKSISAIHCDSRLPRNSHPSAFFKGFVLFMSAGFVVTSSLGIWMAFRFSRKPWTVWFCLAAGIALPVWALLQKSQ